jgi:uncharacterized protein (TIRG00374 family)
VAIYFLLLQVSLADVGQVLGRAQVVPMILVVAFVMGSLVTRAARWQYYFLPRRHVPFSPLLATLAISYMASTFLPLRAGELVRAVFLGQRQRIPVPGIVGTILLEKLFDFLAIGVMLLVVLALTPSLPPAAQGAGVFIAGAILLGFGFVVALAVWRASTLRFVGLVEAWVPFGIGRRLQLQNVTRQFADGTDSLRLPRLWALLLGWSAVTWVCGIGSTFAGILALDVHLSAPGILFAVVLTNASQGIPSSPGYVGVYHAASTLALTTFGVDPATAIGIALITHAFSYGSLVVVGLIALWTGGYTFGDVLKGIRSPSAVSTAVSAEL